MCTKFHIFYLSLYIGCYMYIYICTRVNTRILCIYILIILVLDYNWITMGLLTHQEMIYTHVPHWSRPALKCGVALCGASPHTVQQDNYNLIHLVLMYQYCSNASVIQNRSSHSLTIMERTTKRGSGHRQHILEYIYIYIYTFMCM